MGKALIRMIDKGRVNEKCQAIVYFRKPQFHIMEEFSFAFSSFSKVQKYCKRAYKKILDTTRLYP